ncbi:cyclic GMP-AMP synthase [Misgurnus anguillicaudatus]|uniref:cyclic GMP-AMP synthase n=1 Tax=Misgurnus anguillicaudatus TaxID=75329 RepID=UPI003CCF04BE
MNNQRGQRRPRATVPEQTTAKTQAKVNGRREEQRDSRNDGKHQPTGAAKDHGEKNGHTKKQMEKSGSQDKPATITSDTKLAPQRANGNRQSQKGVSSRDRDETSKTSEDPRAPDSRARKSAHNADHIGDKQDTKESLSKKKTDQRKFESEGKQHKDDAQEIAKSKQCKKETNPERSESQDKSATHPAPQQAHNKRQSQKQNDHSNRNGDDGSPERSTGAHQEKRRANTHNSDHTNSAGDAQKLETPRLVNDKLEKVLHATLDKLKIKKAERSKASSRVNEMTKTVIFHLKRKMTWCEDIESLTTGSYYENVKICEPDEFDVMLTIPVERVDIQRFNGSGAFYSVALKRLPNKHPLTRFLNDDRTIRASEMLNEFRDGVKEAMDLLSFRDKINVQRKKPKCPAVTMQINENGNQISIDFVLGLKVRGSWPVYTSNGFKIEDWLSKKVKADFKLKPYYLVPKYEGKGNADHDGVVAKDVWRISFSHVEKDIMKRHGHSKTCCESKEQKCCRKECLKLLKYLLSQLEKMYPEKMSKFCSYHAKTTLFHTCARKVEDSEWAYSRLANCFQELLGNFVESLRNQDLPNFFVPSQNLLHQDHVPKNNCEFLAKQIELQQNNTFPIFQDTRTPRSP